MRKLLVAVVLAGAAALWAAAANLEAGPGVSVVPVAAMEVRASGVASAEVVVNVTSAGADASSCDIVLSYWRIARGSAGAGVTSAAGLSAGVWTAEVAGILSGHAYHFHAALTNDRGFLTEIDWEGTPFGTGVSADGVTPKFTYTGRFETLSVDDVTVVSFLTSGTFTPEGDLFCPEMLLVGGGGAGGWTIGGGGGGGGVIQDGEARIFADGTDYPVTVGAGGDNYAEDGNGRPNGGQGGDTVLCGLTAYGGGGGGAWDKAGRSPDGGCGGGDAYGMQGQGTTAPGNGVEGQGFAGGACHKSSMSPGGGGGASEKGHDATSGVAGDGGEGITSSITGSPQVYGSGGGGGAGNSCLTPGKGGTNAGAGAAANSMMFVFGEDGTDGFGGGGGGGGKYGSGSVIFGAGGRGGSGVAIVRLAPVQVSCSIENIRLSGSNLTVFLLRNGMTAGATDIYMGRGTTYGGRDETGWTAYGKVGAFTADESRTSVTVTLEAGTEFVIFRLGKSGPWSEAIVLDDLGTIFDSTTYTWKGGEGAWTNAAMWSADSPGGNGYPVAGSKACFNAATVAVVLFDGETAAHELQFGEGADITFRRSPGSISAKLTVDGWHTDGCVRGWAFTLDGMEFYNGGKFGGECEMAQYGTTWLFTNGARFSTSDWLLVTAYGSDRPHAVTVEKGSEVDCRGWFAFNNTAVVVDDSIFLAGTGFCQGYFNPHDTGESVTMRGTSAQIVCEQTYGVNAQLSDSNDPSQWVQGYKSTDLVVSPARALAQPMIKGTPTVTMPWPERNGAGNADALLVRLAVDPACGLLRQRRQLDMPILFWPAGINTNRVSLAGACHDSCSGELYYTYGSTEQAWRISPDNENERPTGIRLRSSAMPVPFGFLLLVR